jgi:succinyl-CoA synthetase beta subunit
LVTLGTGEVVALDAKMVIDDNELDRRPDLQALRDESAEAESEVQARAAGLTFIKLDGNVGCVVNGAGLAMATMDLVKYYGGDPANFLDIGGSSNPEKVVAALRIITADKNVKAILFNIFGGITRTDDVAKGIVEATRNNPVKTPMVIRLTGTNEEKAVKILNEHGFEAMTDMHEAVMAVVALATGGRKSCAFLLTATPDFWCRASQAVMAPFTPARLSPTGRASWQASPQAREGSNSRRACPFTTLWLTLLATTRSTPP